MYWHLIYNLKIIQDAQREIEEEFKDQRYKKEFLKKVLRDNNIYIFQK